MRNLRNTSIIRDALGASSKRTDEVFCEASEAVEPCVHHGREYFLYWNDGPCMHPSCMGDRIKFWEATLPEHGREFRFALKHLDDFISFTLANGNDWMLGRWDDPAAWARSTERYRNERRKDYVYKQLHLELKEVSHEHRLASSGMGNWGGYTMDAYERRFVEQCTSYLVEEHGAAVAACILEMIDLSDVAKLDHEGDLGVARDAIEYAKEQMRRWLRRTNVGPKETKPSRYSAIN